MENKKHVIIYLTIIVLLITLTSIFGVNYYSKKVLDSEVKNILKKDVSKSQFTTKAKAFFGYGKVEEAIKKYMKDYSDNIKKADGIINDETIKKVLSMSNYESDGPKFDKSLKYLESRKNEFNNTIQKLIKMTNEKEIMTYINKYKLSDKYTTLYKNYMFGKEYLKDIENNKKIINKINETGSKILNTDIEVLKFLKDNSNEWTLKDGAIFFKANSLMEKYNSMIEVLNK